MARYYIYVERPWVRKNGEYKQRRSVKGPIYGVVFFNGVDCRMINAPHSLSINLRTILFETRSIKSIVIENN